MNIKSLENKLNRNIINPFNSAKEWSDLMSILKDLLSILESSTKTLNFSEISIKVTLSKRLAQCLNPNLPGGLHESALKVYKIILSNIMQHNQNKLGEDLGLYSSGLFPFFQNASIINKTTYLTSIILEQYVELNSEELELCLPGLLVSVLPGLDEQNEGNLKIIKEIFSKIRQKLSDTVFYGNMWSVIIRNKRLRGASMKYMLETIPSFKTYEEMSENEQKEVLTKYYPQIDTLVINAICCLIEDLDIQTVRNGMDFLIQRFPLCISNTIIDDEQKIKIIISALNLLVKNEYSTARRLFQWLLGGSSAEDDLDLSNEDTNNMIKLLIQGFKKIFNKNIYDKKTVLNSIKIIEQLLNQNVSFSDIILENVSFDMITYICKYWEYTLSNEKKAENDDVIIKFKNFFQKDYSYLESLWFCLAKNLEKIADENDFDKNKNSTKIEEYIIILKFCLLFVEIKDSQSQIKYYIPIISILLSIIDKYSINDINSFTKIDKLINITLIFTKSFQETKKDIKINKQNILRNSVLLNNDISKSNKIDDANKEKYLNVLLKRISISDDVKYNVILNSHNKQSSHLKALSEKIILLQNLYQNMCNIILSSEQSIKVSTKEGDVFRDITELLVRMQEYAQQTTIPEWIKQVQQIALESSPLFSLKACDYLIYLLSNQSHSQIYEIIKLSLLNDYFGHFNSEDKLKCYCNKEPSECSFAELLIAKLWGMIEEPSTQQKVIDLIIKFSESNLDIFIDIISNTFSDTSFQNSVNAIQNFSQFWRLSNEFYPDFIFFKEGDCIFNMLDFLDHDHPLLRHLSKLWLNQSIAHFNKVLDPILRVLFINDTEWKIVEGQVVFVKEYDNKRVTNAFRKLKNIIINTTDSAIKYFLTNMPDESLIQEDKLGKELEINNAVIPRSTYIPLLISISLRFISGKISEDIPESFQNENQSVNAASCEFLEFLLSFVEPKSELLKIAKFIVKPVVDILISALKSQNEFIQVPLLNLLKVLLLSTREDQIKDPEVTKYIFSNEDLRQCLILGLEKSSYFVRGHFLSFIESSLSVFCSNLSGNELFNFSKELINKACSTIYHKVKYTRVNSTKNNFSIFDKYMNKFISKNYLEEYKEYKDFDENDFCIILKGLKQISFHFLNIKDIHISSTYENTSDWLNVKKILFTPYKSTVSFSDYLSSIFSTSNEEDNETNKNINSPLLTFEAIIIPIIVCLSSSWVVHSNVYLPYDYCLNSLGILPYNPSDIIIKKETNIDGLIFENEKETIMKNIIIDITKNLFLKFPVEFISNFFDVWVNNIKQKDSYCEIKDKMYKLTLIEMLVEMKFPLTLILVALNKKIRKDIKYEYTKNSDKKYISNYNIAIKESQFCQFIYSYLIFSQKNINLFNNDDLLKDTWSEMYKLLKYIFDNTKISYTYCWIYELLNAFITIYPPTKAMMDSDEKSNMSDLHYYLNKKLLDIAFNKKFDSIFDTPTNIITPVLPSLYYETAKEIFPNYNLYNKMDEDSIKNEEEEGNNQDYLFKNKTILENENEQVLEKDIINKNNWDNKMNNKITENNSSEIDSIHKFYEEYYDTIRDNNKKVMSDALQLLYQQIVFITLHKNFNNIMTSLYNREQKEKTKYIETLLDNIFKTLKEYHSNNDNNKFFIDETTEILKDVIDVNTEIVYYTSKQLIKDYFFREDFFATTLKNLRRWKVIMERLTSCEKDPIADLVNQMDSGFLFLRASDQEKTKTLRRLSFVIYSCPKDTYSHKLPLIKEKVKDLLMTYGEKPILECELFLMIRVIFFKFSHDNVMEILHTLWPIIFAELVTILKGTKKMNTVELKLESFKFIELMSLANIEEFSLYQWIFIVDTFDLRKLNEQQVDSLISLLLKNQNLFKPVGMYVNENWKISEEKLKFEYKEKSGLIITEKTSFSSSLAKQVAEFFYSIADMNNFEVKVDMNQIEKYIERDFLNKIKLIDEE